MTAKRVIIDEVGGCALMHAFTHHRQMIVEWGRAVGRLELFATIFQNTVNITFTPNAQTVAVYRAFAEAELKRLRRESLHAKLSCSHDVQSHVTVLLGLLNQLPKPN